MKKILFSLVGLLAFAWVQAQQEQQYTQFMYNKLAINPGYAGSKDAICLTGLVSSTRKRNFGHWRARIDTRD